MVVLFLLLFFVVLFGHLLEALADFVELVHVRLYLLHDIVVSGVNLVLGDSNFRLKFGLDLVEHVVDVLDVVLSDRLEVVLLLVYEELGVFGLCSDHSLDELGCAVPFVGAAEALNLALDLVEDLHVGLRDLQILLEDGLRVLAELGRKVLCQVLHLLQRGVVLALSLLEGLSSGLEVLSGLVEFVFFVVGHFDD